jgi:Zn-finger nucleic acid-binding protein
MQEAKTLNCPMCGAAAATDATHCQHCGARLATVACPSCFGLVFIGAKFCSHCGSKIQRVEQEAVKTQLCPRCRVDMNAATVGVISVRECPRCMGIWVESDTLKQVVIDREKQASVLGMASPIVASNPGIETAIRYVPCPVCKGLMNRVNFARCSSVIVDVCRQHGTWFDRDELRRIVDFIHNGGLEKARFKEMEDLKVEQRRLRQLNEAQGNTGLPPYDDNSKAWADGISAVADVVMSFFLK